MMHFNAFASADAQAAALARAVSDALDAVLASRGPQGRATLALSGGKSPAQFLAHLGKMPLAWDRVDVTLIDDRWVPEDDPDSNVGFLRRTLFAGPAASARFIALVDATQSPARKIAALNADDLPSLPDVGVLGMGEDGHTASIFADAPEWGYATTTTDRFVHVTPGAAPHARVSWSLHALRAMPRTFLQISGAKKRAVLEQAASVPQRNAISRLANDGGVKLDVYWYA